MENIGLPRQIGRRMGIGIGNQCIAVQGGKAPVHGRVGGEAGFQRVDFAGKIFKAFLQRIKTGIGAEKGEMRRPDVCGNENDIRAAFQRDFQKIPAIQA